MESDTAPAGRSATGAGPVSHGPPRHMRASLRIGRVAGIDIRLHATFALLIGVVLVTGSAPGGPSVPAQLVWLTVVFASVTVHELAHSLVARRFGIEVAEIDLLPIGGVSRLGSLPREPRQQLEVAAVGPLASVALGLVCAALAAAAGVAVWPPSLVGGSLVVRVAWVNLLLAAFNLVPALPLDGGRVLRAYLAERMDGDAATMIAGRVGRLLAGAMMLAGLRLNVWFLVIGVFVYFGSLAEESAAVVHRATAGLRVRDVMVELVPPELAAPLGDPVDPVDADGLVADTDLLSSDVSARPAVRDGRVVGYVTRRGVHTAVEALVTDWYRHHPWGMRPRRSDNRPGTWSVRQGSGSTDDPRRPCSLRSRDKRPGSARRTRPTRT